MSEDLRCIENDRKSKIEGHRRVSDGQTHQHRVVILLCKIQDDVVTILDDPTAAQW